MREEIEIRDIATGDAGWLIQTHAEYYAESNGFDMSFEALVAEILADFLRNRDPSRDRAFIAARGARRLGSVFCVATDDPEVAQLRLFLVLPEARGTGLAQRLLDAQLAFARAAGYRRMTLWTHESHRAAGAVYARNGFTLTKSEPTRAFGIDDVRQSWERAL